MQWIQWESNENPIQEGQSFDHLDNHTFTAAEAAGLIDDRDIMLDSCLEFSFIAQEMNSNELIGVMKDSNVFQQNATLIKLTSEGNQRPHDVTLAVALYLYL